MKRVSRFLLCAAACVLFQISTAPGAFALPILGAELATFAVLGATTVTNVPTATITGNVGVATGTAITGFGTETPNASHTDSQVSGTVQSNTVDANLAQGQLTAAILALNAFTPDASIAAGIGNLDAFQSTQVGNVIHPGTYAFGAGSTNLVGNLVLDGGGSTTAVWVFQFSSTLITSTTSNVTVVNVGDGSGVGVYWTVGDAATLNGPTFAGNVLANNLISTDNNLTISCGRLLSADKAVTLDGGGNKISIGGCASGNSGGDTGGNESHPPGVPEPGTVVLLGTGIAGLIARRRVLAPKA